MKEILSELVSLNQSAFVPGRHISDNILLTQELMHNYHLDRGPSRCAFKVDIQKAYDMVDWGFMKSILIGFGFHPRMIGWIMECVTTTSFSISINGTLHGYFKGKQGMRQGDPISPYLFTLVMEILTLMLNSRVRDLNNFTYHRYCSNLNIINLCFSDDLFLFSHGDVDSARVIMDSLDEFKNASGVPLVPSRIVHRDCLELMERIKKRVSVWKNKSLSFAGRTQLICFILSFMPLYWASVFILPSSLMLELEQVIRGFLWCQGEMKKGKAKVAWEVVCLPNKEGGLGIRRLEDIPLRGKVSWGWCPLSNVILNRDIYRAGFSLDSKVADIISHGEWAWPIEWQVKYLNLESAIVPLLSNANHGITLRNLNNQEEGFSVSAI
ncbi:putative reverse transcriptase domain, reverse transcriptase zinc-binding domain protein [Tanacetum coccineum]